MSERKLRFESIPRGYEHGCLYVAELANGLVKVGMSGNPRTRLVKLDDAVRRDFDCELLRVYIGPEIASRRKLILAELALIRRMKAEGQAVPRRIEFFSGVGFERAQALAQAVSADFLSSPALPSFNLIHACSLHGRYV